MYLYYKGILYFYLFSKLIISNSYYNIYNILETIVKKEKETV